MDDLDLDFAVTYNGQYIFKQRKSLDDLISKLHFASSNCPYAKKEAKRLALGTKDSCWVLKCVLWSGILSQQVSLRSSVLSDSESFFVSRVSKVVPQKEEDL